jgi:DNA-binding NtrC family response regulator
LIQGESGVGKELVAERLHYESDRAAAPFLTINCAAYTAELLESQLFGHAKGAFTGAVQACTGFFEDAGTGSLFLDEVGELPLALQAKLLRVLENGEFYRLGETQARRSRARVIAATNRDMRDAVRRGVFRQDLYYRLSVLTMQVPPLRERGDDVQLLLDRFCQIYCGAARGFELAPAALARLKRYAFPGNVRELRNIVIRLSAKYPQHCVDLRELEGELETDAVPALPGAELGLEKAAEQQVQAAGFSLDETMEAWERRYINAALKLGGGNLSQAARLLGVNRTTLYSRMQRLALGESQG